MHIVVLDHRESCYFEWGKYYRKSRIENEKSNLLPAGTIKNQTAHLYMSGLLLWAGL
jgi:hypothetical protein